jgi:pyridoxamine 5'-phosphate oxidase
MKDLAKLRTEYSKAILEVQTVHHDPMQQFISWFNDAYSAEAKEPNAMTLSTINAAGKPTARIVLLKGIENDRFVFYTNYQSNKGRDLEMNPACALTFFWPDLERQVRIEGIAVRLDQVTSEEYFQSRPRNAQLGAWASPQSAQIENRQLLEQRIKQLEEKFKGQEVLPKPQQWGGYAVEPILIEFWQGRESRLHDRLLYTREENAWKISRLAP